MKTQILILFIALSTLALGNDGLFYMSGNQLIPIKETNISLQKEVLDIKKVDDMIKVRVHYHLFNPKRKKKLLVGFEAAPPTVDINDRPLDGQHPFISNFSVVMNGKNLEHETSLIIKDSLYLAEKRIKGLNKNEIQDIDEFFEFYNYLHVYHFNAYFKKGKNEIIHEYEFKVSETTMEQYLFEYILTAANRWANHQIDDFTLNLDLGKFQEIGISNTFYDHYNQWEYKGKVIEDEVNYSYDSTKFSRFFLQDAKLQFHQKNFHPNGELYVSSPLNAPYYDDHQFNYEEDILTYNFNLVKDLRKSKNSISHSILKSYPYALRGTVFKISHIQKYYESMDWYHPDYDYKADPNSLRKEEIEWLKKLKE